MTIQRNKVVLRETEVELSDTTVALFAQKKGDTLSFTVGKTTLNFDDIFPLSTGNPGVFGIVLPGGVRLDGLAARKKRLPDSLHFPRSRVARQASRASLGPSK